ncbi:uncharacterized protein [Macrobrachium rosenbergii]|uniref:uncharacterized protein n=1 Tax=Macrobrachium rosenbergii TaxID=79674 RepID=UPI0034D54368
MSVQNKGHSTMGLPRASGKRRWSGEEGADAVPAKVICTSPPHALCAEDVLHHPALTHAHASTPALECELTSTSVESNTSEVSTSELLCQEHSDSTTSFETTSSLCVQVDSTSVFTDSEDESMDDEHEDFIDDEEDKDSGFIDSNSIDNSSDDEVESTSRVISSVEPSVSSSSLSPSLSSQCLSFVSSSCSTTTTTTTTAASTSLQLSLSRVLPHPSTTLSASSESSLLPSPPLSPTVQSTSIPTTFSISNTATPVAVSPLPLSSLTSPFIASTITSSTVTTMTTTTSTASNNEERVPTVSMVSDGSVTTVTAAQTGTVVTSAYQGTLTTPSYDPHSYPYPPESYPSRPVTPAWGSCNFYDGSQPNTNKYMEISPSKPSANQSIQCDENGKSYLELGSASPYTHTYSNDCGNYTTSPSSYPSQSYNQTCTSPSNSSTYGQPTSYFNSRQSYSPNPYNVYPASEGYGNFENETGCGYGYGSNGYTGARGGTMPPSRGPPRCMSPYCDPTQGAARPNCYHQQRLSVLNVSMYKLNRFRQFPEPSLHRSVLICNTLRHIERELEAEGVSVASLLAHSHAHTANPHLQGAAPNQGVQTCPEPMPSSPTPSPTPTEGPLPPMHAPLVGSPLAAPVSLPPSTPSTPPPSVTHYTTASPTVQYPTSQYLPADHPTTFDSRENAHLRQYQSLPPSNSHTDSSGQGPSTEADTEAETEDPPSLPSTRPPALPPEERTDAINWCSVLSLSSQTDLDSMNNNEYGDWGGESSSDMDYSRTDDGPPWKLPSLSADDVLKSFPEASKRLETNEDLDSIINVLVGS